MDGSCASFMRLLTTNYPSGFSRYIIAEQVRTWANEQKKHPGFGEGWHEWFNGDWNKNNDLRNAFTICRNICESVRLRKSAEEWVGQKRECLARERAAAGDGPLLLSA
jgi:hypothetical protein